MSNQQTQLDPTKLRLVKREEILTLAAYAGVYDLPEEVAKRMSFTDEELSLIKVNYLLETRTARQRVRFRGGTWVFPTLLQ